MSPIGALTGRISLRRVLMLLLILTLLYGLSQALLTLIFMKPLSSQKSVAHEIASLYHKLVYDLNSHYEFDKSSSFKIVYDSEIKRVSKADITLVSQCSSNRINGIPKLQSMWQGPTSVAVFAEMSNLKYSLLIISLIKYCSKGKNINIHLVVPTIDRAQNLDLLENDTLALVCEESSFAKSATDVLNYNRSLPYPVNLLRNVAKAGSSTEYIFVTDIDMSPSRHLRRNFLEYIKDHARDKTVFVVPAFEVMEGTDPPDTKQELKAMLTAGLVRPFYGAVCSKCQKHTDYSKWLSLEDSPGMRTAYAVNWKDPWEPFYITKREVPNYDERFQQYGFNRISQVCEVHIAAYEFVVLDNAFITHSGFKKRGSFHSTKDKEQERNRKLFRLFKQELKSKYPESKRRCY